VFSITISFIKLKPTSRLLVPDIYVCAAGGGRKSQLRFIDRTEILYTVEQWLTLFGYHPYWPLHNTNKKALMTLWTAWTEQPIALPVRLLWALAEQCHEAWVEWYNASILHFTNHWPWGHIAPPKTISICIVEDLAPYHRIVSQKCYPNPIILTSSIFLRIHLTSKRSPTQIPKHRSISFYGEYLA